MIATMQKNAGKPTAVAKCRMKCAKINRTLEIPSNAGNSPSKCCDIRTANKNWPREASSNDHGYVNEKC